jgi:hypothetical protein
VVRKPTGKPDGKPPGQHPQAAVDARVLRSLVRRQAKIYRDEQERIVDVVAAERRKDPAYLMSDDIRSRCSEIDQFLARTTQGALMIQKALDSALGTSATEDIEHQLKIEFTRAARTFSADDWDLLDRIRAEQKRKGAA